jgi:hypothetical protein
MLLVYLHLSLVIAVAQSTRWVSLTIGFWRTRLDMRAVILVGMLPRDDLGLLTAAGLGNRISGAKDFLW